MARPSPLPKSWKGISESTLERNLLSEQFHFCVSKAIILLQVWILREEICSCLQPVRAQNSAHRQVAILLCRMWEKVQALDESEETQCQVFWRKSRRKGFKRRARKGWKYRSNINSSVICTIEILWASGQIQFIKYFRCYEHYFSDPHLPTTQAVNMPSYWFNIPAKQSHYLAKVQSPQRGVYPLAEMCCLPLLPGDFSR